MLAVKTPVKKAQAVKEYILSRGILSREYKIERDEESVYFPVSGRNGIERRFKFVKLVEKRPERIKPRSDFRRILEKKLSRRELSKVRTSYDVIGDIAIIEIDRSLRKKEKLIAKALLEANRNIKTVLRKGKHTGEFRVQKLAYLAGENRKKTIHRESGTVMKLDVEKVYFSPRLASERLRVAKKIRPGETVLVMFSGCAPFPLVAAKHSKAKQIYGVEMNPVAHEYGLENLKMNKIKNVNLFVGDVRKVVPKLGVKFDRILMPRPKLNDDFLDVALSAIKKNGFIHFYDFLPEVDIPKRAVEKVKAACFSAKKRCRILGVVKCGQPAVRTYRICVDFKVLR